MLLFHLVKGSQLKSFNKTTGRRWNEPQNVHNSLKVSISVWVENDTKLLFTSKPYDSGNKISTYYKLEHIKNL